MMNDRSLLFLVYAATPVMLVLGLTVMYLVIGDHPWFPFMAGGYVVLLAILYSVKLSIFRKFMRRGDGPGRKDANG